MTSSELLFPALVLAFRIRINKQLDVETEEAELEAKQKGARRKQKRLRKEGAEEQPESKDQAAEVALELLEASPGEVLMVEVDNVAHEDFQVTEEVKVSKGTRQAGA